MSTIADKVKHELRELIPVTVFFLISFQLLALTQALMLEEYGIRATTFLGAAIAALVVAKVVVIADHLPLVNRFPDKPLMYNVVWKTAIYFVASLVVRYAEHVVHFWRKTGDFATANRRLIDEVVWPHFWGVQLWLLILLLVYCALRELVRALGRERVMRMFFSNPVKEVFGEGTRAAMMTRMTLVLALCPACVAAAFAAAVAGGCAAKGRATARSVEGRDASQGPTDPRRIQASNMSFADRYLVTMADEYDRAQLAAKTPAAAVMAQRLKILAATGAMGNAVNPNPVVGLMDMALMVTLTRRIAEDGWVGETFGRETADAMVATLKVQEADAWRIAGRYLTPAQVEELHQLAARWREQHPGQRYILGARLADFAESRQAGGGGSDAAAGQPVEQLAGSALGLVSLDPFHGLDPALKEVAESRVLAERLFFYMRHMPILMTWQADALFDQMLAQPQVMQLFADTTTVAGSTTRFSEATTRFSDASNAVAQSVEKFRLQLPDQQARLVAELDDLVARQRAGALAQATTQVSVERDATIRQFQGVSNESIDRVYQRVRALVLITVGSILLAFILYRRLAVRRTRKTATG